MLKLLPGVVLTPYRIMKQTVNTQINNKKWTLWRRRLNMADDGPGEENTSKAQQNAGEETEE